MDGKDKDLLMTSAVSLLHDFGRRYTYWNNLTNADTSKARKARKERARMLTRQREEELRVQRLSQKTQD